MTREQKIEKVVAEVNNKIGNNCVVKTLEMIKNNNIKSNGIVILENGRIVAPVIYIDYMIDESVENIVEMVIRIYKEKVDMTKFEDIYNFIGNFEQIKNRLSIRLINKKFNLETLNNFPHEDFLDLAIILTININDYGTIKVTNEIFNKWNKTFKDVLEIAKNNFYSSKMNFYSMSDVFGEISDMEDNPMYILSNGSSFWGAGFITNHSVMDNIADKLQSDLMIIPSSVHEVIIMQIDDYTDFDKMSEMICDINATQVEPDEVLSDHIYIYNRETKWES